MRKAIEKFVIWMGEAHPEGLVRCLRILPPGLMSRLQRAAFRRTLKLANSRSAFYRLKFQSLGLELDKVRRPQDLGEWFLTSEELRSDPRSFLCGTPEVAVESSGTTGHAATIFMSHRELEYNAMQGRVLKSVYKLSDDDRVLSTFDHGFCLDGILAQKMLAHWKIFGMCVGRVDPQEIYDRFAQYRFNVVMSGTPWLARFTEVAQDKGRPYPLKLLLGGGGGGITARTRAWIEEFWQAPLCMTYASAETGTVLGFECLRRDGYHLNEFDFFVEIINRDQEGYGEVVISTLSRDVMPLVRYRTRDVARFIEEECPCGLPFRRLSPIRGRTDEIVASVWGNVHPDFFERILDDVPGLADDWQVALMEKNGKQVFQFRLEPKNGSLNSDDVRSRVLGAVEKEHKLAWLAYTQQLAEVEFVFCTKGSLRKGRKLLRLVDERGSRAAL